jgi:membrane associated rhomboid family serine protease
MLSDRPYMRGDYQRERTSVLIWLISAIVAGFIVQLVVASPWLNNGQELTHALGLNVTALRSGWVWTLLTHSFFHSTTFFLHIVGNVVALYLLGRELLPMLGSKRFLGLYAAATVIGGLAWAAVHWRNGGGEVHLGATAAIYGMFIVFACFFPNQQLNFLLFFLFPVTLKPKHVAWTLAVLELVLLIYWEIPGKALPYGVSIASSAHLGGMLTGFFFYRFVYDSGLFGRRRSEAEIELPRWLKRAKKLPVEPIADEPSLSAPGASHENLRAEVDRILDKINSQGLGSLTAEERRLLDEARDQLSRR